MHTKFITCILASYSKKLCGGTIMEIMFSVHASVYPPVALSMASR